MAAKDRARGKAFERWVGARLGGRRRLSHERGNADCDGTPFAIEAKSGYGKPQLPAAWLQQAERHEAEEGRPWALIQRPLGWKDPLVTMRFSTLFNREVLLALLELTNHEGDEDAEESLDGARS